jgi:antitoxin VapB
MITEYHVKLIKQGNQQTLLIPTQLNLNTSFVKIRQENDKLIIEPESEPKSSLIEVLSNLDPLDEDFPDVDQGLLPLDDIEL